MWRRGWSAGLGAAIPLVGLLVYTVVSTGHLFNPAYDYLYRLETSGYPALGYHADWGLEDLRYVPQNLGVGLFGAPVLAADDGWRQPRRLHDARSARCPALFAVSSTFGARSLFRAIPG